MGTRVVISDRALREMVREVLDSTGWSGEGGSPAVKINPITDPSCSVTDPVNPNFTPQDKTEFGVAIQQLVRNLPDTDMPGVFTAVKKALDTRSEKDEIDAATQAAMVAGSQEAIDNAGESGKDKDKHEGKMPTKNIVEDKLRARIRMAILEARGLTEADLKEAGPKFDWKTAAAPTNPLGIQPRRIPAGEHGGEAKRRQEKTAADLRKNLGKSVDRYENDPLPSDEEEPHLPDEESGEEVEKKPKHAHQEIGALGQVGAASFEDIAKETGMSVSGAKQAVDKALLRFKFLHSYMEQDPEGVEEMVLGAMVDYIDMLNKTGELTAADVQLMKDHPDIVRELDGFRDYLHNTIRRTMKQGKPASADDQVEEGDAMLDEQDPSQIRGKSVADPKTAAAASAPAKPGEKSAKMASGKKASIDWGGFDEAKLAKSPILTEAAALVMSDNKGPYVIADGVEARPSHPNRTQYKAGTRVNVHRRGKKGVFIVEMPNGEQWTNVLKEAPKKGKR